MATQRRLFDTPGTPRRPARAKPPSTTKITRTVGPDPAGLARMVAATDGSALGNPGPSGWAWWAGEHCWAAGGFDRSTNNIAELEAIRQLLAATTGADIHLTVEADSRYAIDALTQWVHGWRRNGWRTGNGKPVANVELIQEAAGLVYDGRTVTFEWVKGHAGHMRNEAADRAAQAAARRARAGHDPAAGPGWTR